MNTKRAIESIHFFMFPFQWDFFAKGKDSFNESFKNRTKLKDIKKLFHNNELNWQPTNFEIKVNKEDKYHTFNEFNYFHDYVRNVLAVTKTQEDSVLKYKYNISNHATFEFSTIGYREKKKEGIETAEYSLKINEILINFYETGVGNLIFHLENYDYSKSKDILRINDYGRRIYPQFLGVKKPFSDGPKFSFLPDEIRLKGVLPNGEDIYDDFSYYDCNACLKGEPIRLPNHIQRLLDKRFGISKKTFAHFENCVVLRPVIDDRMFTMSFYINYDLINQFKQDDAHLEHPFWYAYLFVDSKEKDLTIKYPPMQRKLLQLSSYLRWIGNETENGHAKGHLFGATRYSFMILASDDWFSKNILNNHFRYIYFQMVCLVLIQRASILRFSAEAANIMTLLKGKEKNEQKLFYIKELYLEYIYFINKILFREITPQEQGIELYDMLRSRMEIDTDAKALEKEIEDLHKYGLLLDGEKGNIESRNLNIIATIFASFSLVAAFFGFSNFPEKFPIWNAFFIWIIVSLAMFIMLYFLLQKITNHKKS